MEAESRIAIKTPVGEICGRDAIYLDSMVQEGPVCAFSGELNAGLCSEYAGGLEFIPYTLKFHGVRAFTHWKVDCYPKTAELNVMHFCTAKNSALLRTLRESCDGDESLQTLCHYVFATYDAIYEIAAQRYDLTLGYVPNEPAG